MDAVLVTRGARAVQSAAAFESRYSFSCRFRCFRGSMLSPPSPARRVSFLLLLPPPRAMVHHVRISACIHTTCPCRNLAGVFACCCRRKVWSYLYTTAGDAVKTSYLANGGNSPSKPPPLAGLGYGLPLRYIRFRVSRCGVRVTRRVVRLGVIPCRTR